MLLSSNHPGKTPGAGSVLTDSEGRSAHHPCKHTLYVVLRQQAEQLRIPPNKHTLHASAALADVSQEPPDRDTMAAKKPPLVFGVKAEWRLFAHFSALLLQSPVNRND